MEILKQFYGRIPFFRSLVGDVKVEHAAFQLGDLTTGCAMVVDTMGLGETDTASCGPT